MRTALARVALAFLASFCIVTTTLTPSVPAEAADATVTQVSGDLVTAENGLPVSGATISLVQGSTVVATATSDTNGHYTFGNVTPGIYTLRISAQGLQTTEISNVLAGTGGSIAIRTTLPRQRTEAGGIQEIGRVTAKSQSLTDLIGTSTIKYNVDPIQLQQQGFLKAGDALGALPGVNLNGTPHGVGDDTFLDIRGMGVTETRALMDGHPIGPGGSVAPNGNAQNYGFNYSNSAFNLMNNIQVTEGSGATGLYGVNAIGGTIDFQTMNPTVKPQFFLQQQVGTSGTDATLIKATGSFGNLGYALGGGVTGTYGSFSPQYIFQSSRPNNDQTSPAYANCTNAAASFPVDLTSCNQASNTYLVSGNYLVRDDIAKLKYNLTPTTALTVTGYWSNELADSTGNGDDDNIPYNTRLQQINDGTAYSGALGQNGCAANLYAVATDANPNACYTATQLANATYGPAGGGNLRTRGVRLYDYDSHLTSTIGANNVNVDYYQDFYQYHKESCFAAGFVPGVGCQGSSFSNNFYTTGFLVSDDLVLGDNDLGFGWFNYHQLSNGNTTSGPGNPWVNQPDLGTGQYSFFLRDIYTPSSFFNIYFNGWLVTSNVVNQTKFDPRLSFIFKPTSQDSIRLTAGQTDGFPNESLKAGGVTSNGFNSSSLGSGCPALGTANAANVANPLLTSETALDTEAAYSHRFWSDTSLGVVGYISSEKNQLYQATVPVLSLPGIASSPVIVGIANDPTITGKIGSNCGVALTPVTVLPYLGVTTTINVASAMYRGLLFQGRIRANPRLFMDFNYQLSSAQQFGIPAQILQTPSNAWSINGGQIYEIPYQKGSANFDFQDLKGLEVQLTGYFVGNNNTFNRPGYTYFNAFVTKRFNQNVSLTLSGTNIFNQNTQVYGYYGQQVNAPTNPFWSFPSSVEAAVQTGLATGSEELGLSPPIVSATLSVRL